ncbi:hypothetical protein POM88_020447 [Heracleum sosnowskyi]|uniref:Longin domain-containing protein n=1 Tax=Heracleum sosnowskyi TaxID=360622 RepID=A0AAD8MRV8_9APIA|nr:hypothetical protein POM88_020447 [Heracleum sosnowskyi]
MPNILAFVFSCFPSHSGISSVICTHVVSLLNFFSLRYPTAPDMMLSKKVAYCVVAKDTVGKQISIAFLERVAADFKKRYGGGKAGTTVAKSLNKEFGPLMKQHMQYIIDHADEIDKLIKVKAQVSEVKSICWKI